MFVMLIYGIVNLTKTLVTGEPVYPPLNFHDAMSWVWAVLLVLLEGLGYMALYYLTKWKLSKVYALDVKQHSEMTVFNISNLDKSNTTNPNHSRDV